MSIIDPIENRYAVIGVDVNKTEHWYLRWDLGSSKEEIYNHHKPYLRFYDRIEVWVVDCKDKRLYGEPDYVFENNELEEKPNWLIDFENGL